MVSWTVEIGDEFELEFDPLHKDVQTEILAGDKSGRSAKRFYRELIRKADGRFGAHLTRLKKKGN